MEHDLTLIPYSASYQKEWDQLISDSRNGTFLLKRGFMDYHSDRFRDCSIMFQKKGKTIACFPANYSEGDSTVYSHQGLTYGGLILHPEASAIQVLEMFDLVTAHYSQNFGATRVVYKCIPHVYHRYPCEEDLYGLFVNQAKLQSRGLSSAIDLTHPIPYNRNRMRMLRKAEESGLRCYTTSEEQEVRDYWLLLNDVLTSRHGVRPVHSADEMLLLMRRFPEQIQQYICRTPEGELVGGAWVFLCNGTVHVQYGSTSDTGKVLGALDFLYRHLQESYKDKFHYMEFGISTENGGKYLNTNLIHSKESFGGRGICYDIYEIVF